MTDPLSVPYRERERSVTMDRLGDDEPHEELLPGGAPTDSPEINVFKPGDTAGA